MLTGGPIRCLPVAFCRNEPASPTCRQGACALRGARFQLVAGFSGGDTVPASRVLSGALTLADGTVCPVDPATRIYGKFIGPVARRVIVPYGGIELTVACPSGPLAEFRGFTLHVDGSVVPITGD
jgi:hypothetical protein